MNLQQLLGMAALAVCGSISVGAEIRVEQLDIATGGKAGGKIAVLQGAAVPGLAATGNTSLVLDVGGAGKSAVLQVAVAGNGGEDAKVRFYVIGDGKILAESGIVKKGETGKTLKADLTGVKQLVLKTDDAQTGVVPTVGTWAGTITTEGDGKVAVVEAGQAVPELQVYLDQLDVSKVATGYGEPGVNVSAEKNPVTLKGKTFKHALGTHAVSTMVVDLKGAAKSFSAVVGVDDDASELGTVGFTVVGDGKVLVKTGTLHREDKEAKKIAVDLTGVKQLVLLVDSGDDENMDMDHADWADAVIVMDPAKAKERPVAVDAGDAVLPK